MISESKMLGLSWKLLQVMYVIATYKPVLNLTQIFLQGLILLQNSSHVTAVRSTFNCSCFK